MKVKNEGLLFSFKGVSWILKGRKNSIGAESSIYILREIETEKEKIYIIIF
jgi:hypothetical protein